MKKKMILLSLLASATFCLGGCDLGNGTNNSDKNNDNTNINQKENEGKKENEGNQGENDGELHFELEAGTPQSWIDLFTFTNVTIVLKNNVTIKRGDEYRCVDGQWYCKPQGFETFDRHNGRNIFDLYMCNYSKFSFDEVHSCYKAEGWLDEASGYTREVAVHVNTGKITKIEDAASLNSSVITSELTFGSYGETTI